MQTIRYYTRGRYVGFEKLDPAKVLNYVSWIRSGNDLKIGNTLINDIDYIKELCKNISS